MAAAVLQLCLGRGSPMVYARYRQLAVGRQRGELGILSGSVMLSVTKPSLDSVSYWRRCGFSEICMSTGPACSKHALHMPFVRIEYMDQSPWTLCNGRTEDGTKQTSRVRCWNRWKGFAVDERPVESVPADVCLANLNRRDAPAKNKKL